MAQFSKRHYEIIAAVVAKWESDGCPITFSNGEEDSARVVGIEKYLADAFQCDNPRFDRERFYDAIG